MPKNVPVLCTHNSARSVLSEGMVNHLAKNLEKDVRAYSAGSAPSGRINPYAIEALSNAGVNGRLLQHELKRVHRARRAEDASSNHGLRQRGRAAVPAMPSRVLDAAAAAAPFGDPEQRRTPGRFGGSPLRADLSTPQKLFAEFLGTALLLAIAIDSGIVGERLAGGNVAAALVVSTRFTVGGL